MANTSEFKNVNLLVAPSRQHVVVFRCILLLFHGQHVSYTPLFDQEMVNPKDMMSLAEPFFNKWIYLVVYMVVI